MIDFLPRDIVRLILDCLFGADYVNALQSCRLFYEANTRKLAVRKRMLYIASLAIVFPNAGYWRRESFYTVQRVDLQHCYQWFTPCRVFLNGQDWWIQHVLQQLDRNSRVIVLRRDRWDSCYLVVCRVQWENVCNSVPDETDRMRVLKRATCDATTLHVDDPLSAMPTRTITFQTAVRKYLRANKRTLVTLTANGTYSHFYYLPIPCICAAIT